MDDQTFSDTRDGLIEWVAKYLYDNYACNKEPDTHLNAPFGQTRDFYEINHRVRDIWYGEAHEFLKHFAVIINGKAES